MKHAWVSRCQRREDKNIFSTNIYHLFMLNSFCYLSPLTYTPTHIIWYIERICKTKQHQWHIYSHGRWKLLNINLWWLHKHIFLKHPPINKGAVLNGEFLIYYFWYKIDVYNWIIPLCSFGFLHEMLFLTGYQLEVWTITFTYYQKA